MNRCSVRVCCKAPRDTYHKPEAVNLFVHDHIISRVSGLGHRRNLVHTQGVESRVQACGLSIDRDEPACEGQRCGQQGTRGHRSLSRSLEPMTSNKVATKGHRETQNRQKKGIFFEKLAGENRHKKFFADEIQMLPPSQQRGCHSLEPFAIYGVSSSLM